MNIIEKMITSTVRCTLCNTQGMGNCDCWVKCGKCGWSFEKGAECRNCKRDGGALPTKHYATHMNGELPNYIFNFAESCVNK